MEISLPNGAHYADTLREKILSFRGGTESVPTKINRPTYSAFDGAPKPPAPKFTNKAILMGLGITALIGAGIWVYNKIKKPDTELDIEKLARKALEGGGLSKPIEVIKINPKETPKEQPLDCEAQWRALAEAMGLSALANQLKIDPVQFLVNCLAQDVITFKNITNTPFPYYSVIKINLCSYSNTISRDCAIELMKRVLAKANLSHLLDDPNYDLNKMYDECEADKINRILSE